MLSWVNDPPTTVTTVYGEPTGMISSLLTSLMYSGAWATGAWPYFLSLSIPLCSRSFRSIQQGTSTIGRRVIQIVVKEER